MHYVCATLYIVDVMTVLCLNIKITCFCYSFAQFFSNNLSINQNFIFLSITKQIFILKLTHVVKKKRNQRKNDIQYIETRINTKGYKSNTLKHASIQNTKDLLLVCY